jgi:hypothetical protein
LLSLLCCRSSSCRSTRAPETSPRSPSTGDKVRPLRAVPACRHHLYLRPFRFISVLQALLRRAHRAHPRGDRWWAQQLDYKAALQAARRGRAQHDRRPSQAPGHCTGIGAGPDPPPRASPPPRQPRGAPARATCATWRLQSGTCTVAAPIYPTLRCFHSLLLLYASILISIHYCIDTTTILTRSRRFSCRA